MLIRKNPKTHYQFNRINQFMQTLLLLMGVVFCIPLEHTWPISIGNKAFTDTRFDSSKNKAVPPQTFALNNNSRDQ